uniref:Aspartate aminotransferase n=1 Tax=Schistocephalus solidus TaxID=70667 RepID=A0A0X3P2A5_SCHSO
MNSLTTFVSTYPSNQTKVTVLLSMFDLSSCIFLMDQRRYAHFRVSIMSGLSENMYSVFCDVQKAPPIEVTTLSEQCQEDSAENKVNLTLGVYRPFNGKPSKIPVVRKVEIEMAQDPSLNKDYLPITGLPAFCSAGIRLLLGSEHPAISSNLVDAVQCIGGSGAVYLAAQFLKKILKFSTVLIPKPSWPSHCGICLLSGYNILYYRYWNQKTQCLDFTELLEDISSAPDNSVVILHACAHNPTGMDLAPEQWMELAQLMKKKRLFPLFDIAYQGLASGDIDQDAWAIRMFLEHGFEFFAAQSFSKNFGLYNDRVGNLVFGTMNKDLTANTKSQLLILARYCWSNPPNHGATIVSKVLNDPQLYAEWKSNLREMSDRIVRTRQLFYEKLTAMGTPGNWENIIKQRGMFSYTGLSREQTNILREKFHVYMTGDGRMNMCGLNESNIDYVVKAFHETVLCGAAGDVTQTA